MITESRAKKLQRSKAAAVFDDVVEECRNRNVFTPSIFEHRRTDAKDMGKVGDLAGFAGLSRM
jgi:hypothetical protein